MEEQAKEPKRRGRGAAQTLTTSYKKATFLKFFRKLGGLMLACEAAHISHDAVLQWREKDPAFADAFNTAKETDTEQLEAKARQRAMKRSDILMMFLLNGRRPEMYRQNAKVTHAGGITVRDLLVDDDQPAKGAK